MRKIEGPIKTDLAEGDAYVDRPILKEKPVYCGRVPMATKVIDHYRREPLIWMKPDGRGGLVPR